MIARVALAAVIAVAAAGCDRVECGDGTSEAFGQCVAGSGADASYCGADTEWDPALQVCVGVDPVSCGSSAEVDVTDDGTTVCWSFHSDCVMPCPAADSGKVTLCGRLVDGESGDPLEPLWGELCDPANPIDDGVCSLALTVRDGPGGAALTVGNTRLNRCGFFVLDNVDAPASGIAALEVDEAVGADLYATTVTALAAESGARVTDLRAYALRHRTDAKWTEGAGDPFAGDSFADRGVAVAIFRHNGEPMAGVTLLADGAPAPTTDYYFADGDHERALVAPGDSVTGTNGAALWVDGSDVAYTGQGGDLEGCVWPAISSGATAADTAVFHIVDSVDPGTGEVCE